MGGMVPLQPTMYTYTSSKIIFLYSSSSYIYFQLHSIKHLCLQVRCFENLCLQLINKNCVNHSRKHGKNFQIHFHTNYDMFLFGAML
jgi:hypothetical protein